MPFISCLCLAPCRKQTVEIQSKLKAALADRVAAIADKANLERAMKQSKSQALTLEKTLEKKDAVENKKRESILVVSILRMFSLAIHLLLSQPWQACLHVFCTAVHNMAESTAEWSAYPFMLSQKFHRNVAHK